MTRSRAFAALALLLSACASGPGTKPGDGPGGELEVVVELENTGSQPREGELATLVFKIHNKTKSVLVLRDLTLPRDLMLTGSTSAVVTWQFAQSGLVTYLPEKDEWTYEKGRRSDVRRPVFNTGLLVPDEKLVVRARVRLLEMPMDFQFSFFELSSEELRRKVYFEFREPKMMRYRALIGSELQSRLVPSIRNEESGHRIVVFPHAEPVASTSLLLKTFRLQQPLRPRTYTLDQAAARIGIPRPKPGEYTYSIIFDGWVVPKDKGHVLVTPVGVTALPELRQMERTFHLIDSAAPEKVTIDLRAHAAASALGELKYPLVKDEKEVPVTKDVKEKRIYYYLFLTPEQCGRLLVDLAKLKLTLDVEYGEGGGRLVIHNR